MSATGQFLLALDSATHGEPQAPLRCRVWPGVKGGGRFGRRSEGSKRAPSFSLASSIATAAPPSRGLVARRCYDAPPIDAGYATDHARNARKL